MIEERKAYEAMREPREDVTDLQWEIAIIPFEADKYSALTFGLADDPEGGAAELVRIYKAGSARLDARLEKLKRNVTRTMARYKNDAAFRKKVGDPNYLKRCEDEYIKRVTKVAKRKAAALKKLLERWEPPVRMHLRQT
jgi:hypothetical protein